MTNEWRKASRSGAGNDCIEIRSDRIALTAIRDSKNPAQVLALRVDQLVAFARALR